MVSFFSGYLIALRMVQLLSLLKSILTMQFTILNCEIIDCNYNLSQLSFLEAFSVYIKNLKTHYILYHASYLLY